MAILDLTHGQEKLLQSLIVRENRELLEFPDSFFRPIGDVIALPDGRAAAYLLGDPQDVETLQISGKVYVKYTRLDLARFFANINRGVFIANPTSTQQLVARMGEQFGIVIPEAMVYDDPLSGESGTVTVRLKVDPKRSFILSSTEFELSWEKPRALDLRDLFTSANLVGFDPEIPYLEMIENIFTVSGLNGHSAKVVPYWPELSSDWYVPGTNWSIIDAIYFYAANGAYNASVVANMVNVASQGKEGVWVCDNSATKPNLYGGRIASNGANTEYCGLKIPARKLVFSPVAGATGGEGDINIFYEIVDLSDETFVLDDSQVALRQWLNSMNAPVYAYWDVNKAPQLFNVVTGNKYGSWVASGSGGLLRNLWGSGLELNERGSWTVGGKTYNRRAKWTLFNWPNYSVTTKGALNVYYNAA